MGRCTRQIATLSAKYRSRGA